MDAGCPDPGGASDLAEFIASLGRLRAWAGSPSYRILARRVGPLLCPPQTVAHSTIADVFQARRRRLDLDLVVAIVRALGLDETGVGRWRDACVTAHARAGAGAGEGGRVGGLRQLPADLATFTGREREVRAILGAVGKVPGSGATVVISAIDGMAGVGKSALAVRAAHLLADRFPDGQLFLNLDGYTQGVSPRDPADALAEQGHVRQVTGDYPEAGEAHIRALEIFREIGARGNEAYALNYYAATVAATGDLPRALALYQQALAMNQELNKPDDEAVSLEGIGDHPLATGDTPQGRAHLHQALEIYQRLGMSADVERVQAKRGR